MGLVTLVHRRMRSKGPPPQPQPQPQVLASSGGAPGPGYPAGGDLPAGDGLPGSRDRPQHPPGLPLQPLGCPPGDGGDSGGGSGGDDGETPQDTDQDIYNKHHRQLPEDPDSSGDDDGRGCRARHQTLLTINKWAKPLPKLELSPRVHLQKASKVKQIWELWSVNVALGMSTWNDVAVTYHQSQESYQDWPRSGMADRFAYEKRDLHGRKAPVPATCDLVEALL